MKSLKQMIKNKIEDDKGLVTKLATKMGHANPSTLHKFLNTPERELEDFNVLLTLVRELFPDREFEVMGDYIKTLNANKKTVRHCLEYTEMYKLNEIHQYLIETMRNCSNEVSREWASVYELRLKRYTENLTGTSGLHELSKINVKSEEMKCFIDLLRIFSLFDLNLLSELKVQYELLVLKMNDIQDSFIRNSYLRRLTLIGSNCYLKSGDVKKAREIALSALNEFTSCNTPAFYSFHYLLLGNSYILEDFESAQNYLIKGVKLSVNYHENETLCIELRKSINFNKIHWGKKPDYLKDITFDEITTKHQESYYCIKQNDLTKAKAVLGEIYTAKLTTRSKAFYYYYKGLAEKNNKYLLMSIKFFDSFGDKYWKKLPLMELERLGEDMELIEALSI